MFKTWQQVAEYCEREFGSYVNWTERFFHCPECDEPIYECDWEGEHNWDECPVCECMWEEVV